MYPRAAKEVGVEVITPITASGAEELRYKAIFKTEEDTSVRDEGVIPIYLISEASLTITSLDLVPSKPKIGDLVTFTVSMFNAGGKPVYMTRVSVSVSGALEVLRRDAVFIGKVDPQNPASAPFTFNATGSGECTINVVVEYVDEYGYPHEITRNVTLRVAKAEELGSSEGKTIYTLTMENVHLLVVVLVILALAVFVVVRHVKRGRRR